MSANLDILPKRFKCLSQLGALEGVRKARDESKAALCRLISKTAGNNGRMWELGLRVVGFQVAVSSLSGVRCSDLQASNMTGGFLQDKRIQGWGLDLSQK